MPATTRGLTGNQVRKIRWEHYAGILLLSFATLLLELALTRVLSVANWYHFGDGLCQNPFPSRLTAAAKLPTVKRPLQRPSGRGDTPVATPTPILIGCLFSAI